VVEIRQISAYSCRGMNGNSYAHISEHAFGNALDIASFTLADGRQVSVKDGWRGLPEEQGFLRDVEAAACQQFSTVLAPGSNAYHYNHIHVDPDAPRQPARDLPAGRGLGRGGRRAGVAAQVPTLRANLSRRDRSAARRCGNGRSRRQGQRGRRVRGRLGLPEQQLRWGR
jgi:hypothetical protein